MKWNEERVNNILENRRQPKRVTVEFGGDKFQCSFWQTGAKW